MPEVKFNSKIYKKEAIKEAISAYSHLAKFSLGQSKKYIEVKIDKISPRVKNIISDEFANYILGLTKKCL